MVAVGAGIQKDLAGRYKITSVPRQKGDGGRQIPSGAVADKGHPFGGEMEQFIRMHKNLFGHLITVIQSTWKAVFRCQTVIHRNNQAACQTCHGHTNFVITVDVACHPSAAVKKQQNRGRRLPFRR